ncbi:MAG: 23S rRNA pseudouridine(955/2504/2580) synthase [Gammaproteobacteria bacterium]|nr:23S rRNA pseudouridine(955/2504/2580) synthase [Gammaproteobacteria bacterium]|tara:strand:+ start:2233 stop:3189 length:957 start_codon:yes stop_codon:yes gene_type:complete
MKDLSKKNKVIVPSNDDGMRLDNYLIKIIKGIPKSRIYRMIRKGEVRINSKRAKPSSRVHVNDKVRIPPNTANELKTDFSSRRKDDLSWINNIIIFENDSFLLVNKPSGLAVHGGSGIHFGLIELLRSLRKKNHEYLELVHRLDKETSGCLLISKKKSKLRKLHEYFREGKVKKTYLGLLVGKFKKSVYEIDQPLRIISTSQSGRIAVPEDLGKKSKTKFIQIEKYKNSALFKIEPITGKTHQIRAHAKYMKTPLAGDQRYGIQPDQIVTKYGLNRLFLHAESITFPGLSPSERSFSFNSELDPRLTKILQKLRLSID